MICSRNDAYLSLLTVPIRTIGKTEIASGTAFFFETKHGLYLITNRHLIYEKKSNFFPKKIIGYFHLQSEKDGKSTFFDLMHHSKEYSLPLYTTENKPRWWDYSINVDLIILPINLPKHFAYQAFSLKMLPSKDFSLAAGDPLFVIGYPEGFFDKKHNLPIVTSGTVASTLPCFFKMSDPFLLNSDATYGNSGSPVIRRVFLKNDSKKFNSSNKIINFMLVGIFMGFVALTNLKTKSSTRPESKLKLSWIFSAELIREILQKNESKKIKKK